MGKTGAGEQNRQRRIVDTGNRLAGQPSPEYRTHRCAAPICNNIEAYPNPTWYWLGRNGQPITWFCSPSCLGNWAMWKRLANAD